MKTIFEYMKYENENEIIIIYFIEYLFSGTDLFKYLNNRMFCNY
jgi:hypothetical protein